MQINYTDIYFGISIYNYSCIRYYINIFLIDI